MKVTMRLLHFILCTAMMFGSRPILSQAEEPDAGMAPQQQAQDLEKVVQTLNDALKENRELREAKIEAETTLDQARIQNNRLMSQVRELQAETDDIKREKKKESQSLDQMRADIDKQKEALEAERQKFLMEQEEAEKRTQEILAENERLSQLLDHSILEEEREPLQELIDETKATAKQAVSQIAKSKTENEKLKNELAEQYYALGNLFFEKKEYKMAVKKYVEALEFDPTDAWAHHNLGIIYDYYLVDHIKAIEHYRQYLRLKAIEEETDAIRERVVHLELQRLMVPGQPLKAEYKKYVEDLSVR
ncbi:MAG: hypothetical protein COV74_04465 [Candidatus Omnitrophica bacterium CG11_big_fil_rev_8_21_14_0_20_45_26]|uniref:Uncharacterized protein n=1 Tax=Candidatus Abzuiibacterium crystallinum TaxID=1974748 RepID=A0A2H0LS90_9BACT|nr:MAG: hypothetical protein COV74_04465 [Candidatus Omnitrophica bacterium CG11_big_fil_rev_8_21_14_0_20_45_26]PIW64281.1 MAG: hypothetical protein COW12_06985 [Candidatus Omnitrophica bacterium CG12_big_fil_rev_8_21_14_0_65_45_16]